MLDLGNPQKADVIILSNPSEIPKTMVSHFGKACRWICVNSPKPFANSRFEEVQADHLDYIDDVAFNPSKDFNIKDIILFYCSEEPLEKYEYDIATGSYKDVPNYIGYCTASEAIEMALSAKDFKSNNENMTNIYKHFKGEKSLKSYNDLIQELKL